jgi:hypothetical protein
MALRWIEGFDYIDAGQFGSGLSNILGKRYPFNNTTTGFDTISVAGQHGNGMSVSPRYASQYFETPALTYGDTWIIGCRIALSFTPTDAQQFIQILDENRDVTAYLRIYGDGTLQYVGGASGTKTQYWYGGTGPQFYLELKVTLHDTTGSYAIHVNGEALVSQTSFDTKSESTTGASSFRFRGFANTVAGFAKYSDIYVCDDTGGVNNDFLGPIRVLSLHPNADGDDEDWTLSSGSDSYALVNETEPVDGDSDYIEDTTTSNRTLFTYDDVPAGMGDSIIGVQIATNPRITDATPYDLINVIKSGGTLYPESAVTVDDESFNGMGHVMQLLENDPDTGSAWTASGLNNAQFGVEVG